jgi:hypothetical protein
LTAILDLLQAMDQLETFMTVLTMYDMNIRGSQIWSQIWVLYKDFCGKDPRKMAKVVKQRDSQMIEYLNSQAKQEGSSEMATHHGVASWYRKNQNLS